MTIWLISDTHFGHANIINFANRPFSNVKEMDQYMVEEWNRRVAVTDCVYHLGDVTMARSSNQKAAFVALIRSLHGHKQLVLGNHDHYPAKVYTEAGFEKIRGTGQWLGDGLLLSHFPVHPDNLGFRTKACVHGHIHEKESPKPYQNSKGTIVPYINVCVENTAYGPVAVEEVWMRVREVIQKWEESLMIDTPRM